MARVPRPDDHDGPRGRALRLRARDVGVQHQRAALRHADGAHALAVLDRQLRGLHGGPLLRVLTDDALPLPRSGRAQRRAEQSAGGTRTTDRSTSPRECAIFSCSACKYYIAFSPTVVAQANADRQLKLIATTRAWPSPGVRWYVYLIKNSPMVQPLTSLPNVVAGVTSRVAWLDVNEAWWLKPSDWNVPARRRWSEQLATGSHSPRWRSRPRHCPK